MHQRLLFICSFLILSTTSFAQQGLRDSLLNVIATSNSDTTKISAYCTITEDALDSVTLGEIEVARKLIDKNLSAADSKTKTFFSKSLVLLKLNEAAYYFVVDNNFAKAIATTEAAISEAKKTGDNTLIGTTLNNLAIVLYSNGDTEGCLKNLKEALTYRELGGNKSEINQSYANLGYILFRTGRQNEALEYLYKSLKLCDETKDFGQKATTLHYLGQVYNQQKEYQRELQTSLEALELYKKHGTEREISSGYNNLGSLYQTLGKYDSSFYYHSNALELRRKLNYQYGIANSQNNIGRLHIELKEFDKALACFREAYRIWDGKKDVENLSSLCLNIATLYKKMNIADSVKHYAQLGYDYSKEARSLDDTGMNSELLSWAYEQKGDFKNALKYYREFHSVTDSLYNDKSRRESEQRMLNYEFETKEAALKAEQEKKDAVSAAQLQDQKLIRNISFGAGALALLLALVAFNRYRLKQRTAKQLEEKNVQVEAARERAEQSEKFKQQFLANMSHEIRTPMNAIIGMSKLLQDHQHDEKSTQYINAIRHSSENLLVILNDVLDLSKLEAGKMQIDIIAFNLKENLQLIQESFRPKAEEKGLKLILNLFGEFPKYVKGDAGRLNQVLNNLVSNAIKFSPTFLPTDNRSHVSDMVWINVTLNESDDKEEVSENRNYFEFLIRDSGPGIPQEKLETIFESFTQANTSDSRIHGGTGLGLTIARNLVRLLGGELKVDGDMRPGSAFFFTIPLQEVSVEEFAQATKAKATITQDARELNILLAEDNDYNAIVATDTIAKYFPNAIITRFSNGNEVMNHLRSAVPPSGGQGVFSRIADLILMDVQMPQLDGYQTTQQIRSSLPSPQNEIPILALTASVIRTDLEKCIEAGMNGYIAKPFADENLVRSIQNVLAKRVVRMDEKTKRTDSTEKFRQLFLKVVPERLQKVEEAFAKDDRDEVRKLVHLMRPQLQAAGVSFSENDFEIIETFSTQTDYKQFEQLTASFIAAIKSHLSSL